MVRCGVGAVMTEMVTVRRSAHLAAGKELRNDEDGHDDDKHSGLDERVEPKAAQ